MFSVLFPGQGSQAVGMIKNLYNNFTYVKSFFNQADEILQISLSKMILEGPKEILDKTENTQPAVFLASYSLFQVIKNETSFDLNKAKFFAGHSLGEYSALACAESISFEQTIKLLKHRGKAMSNAVPSGEGGMIAVLGTDIENINEIININNYECFIANDNSVGQIVISGVIKDLDSLSNKLKEANIKNIKLSVSAPFHCKLMNSATEIMNKEINNVQFEAPKNNIISNVTASSCSDPNEIKKLLVQQIEKPVRWRESVINMINSGVQKFIEIGPGKVLSGLVKRIDRNVKLIQVNDIEDLKNLN